MLQFRMNETNIINIPVKQWTVNSVKESSCSQIHSYVQFEHIGCLFWLIRCHCRFCWRYWHSTCQMLSVRCILSRAQLLCVLLHMTNRWKPSNNTVYRISPAHVIRRWSKICGWHRHAITPASGSVVSSWSSPSQPICVGNLHLLSFHHQNVWTFFHRRCSKGIGYAAYVR